MLRKWGALVLVLLAMPALAFAQNTGKLAGRVIDGSTGDGLPGATVVIEGTTLGTATDVDGNYFILGVPVGTYNVQASFVGFQTTTETGVEVSSGYTREIDFTLSPGVELDEIIVEYERPLIQKDAVGVPKIVNAEEIVSLPVRGAAQVAAIQAGVVSREGSETLNIRGGRGAEVTYFIDGVKVVGTGGSTIGVPQSAIQEQEILIGAISARYGDAMSGVISITTKAGSPKFFGSIEGITSESLDNFGYNLASATLGGPIIPNKLSFFIAGEFVDEADRNPRAQDWFSASDQLLNDLRGAPTAFPIQDGSGNDMFLTIPGTLADGAQLLVDDSGAPDVSSGALVFSDGTTVPVPDGADISTLNLVTQLRAEQLTANDFDLTNEKRGFGDQNISLSGNLTWNVFQNGRLRLGGRYNTREFDDLGFWEGRALFSPELARIGTRDDYQLYATWTQYLSNSTFYQLQVDFSDREGENYDPRFGNGFDDFLRYGDVDDPVFSALQGYKNLTFTPETRIDDHGTEDTSDDTEFIVQVPTFVNRYQDGQNISSETTAGLVSLVGGRYNGYAKFHNTQFRLSASATTQVGINQIEFGAEYEQRTQRSWSITASGLARYFADGDPESIAPDDPNLNPAGYSSYNDIPLQVLNNLVANTGFDLRGQNEVDDENFSEFLSTDINKSLAGYNVAPYEPIYYGGYVQDKIEFRDIVLNLGLRVDVFDNNTRILRDRFARRPVERAGAGAPAGIGSDFAVYFSGNDVVGYRDLDGNFYDDGGQRANAGDILLAGKPRQLDAQITEDMFEDYEPEVTVMPRIGVSFPVTDQALFFASYGVVSQRPSTNTFASIAALDGTGRINNNNLKPEKTTKYELGFRQRLGARSALTISGFFHQIENLIQLRDLRFASPSAYSTFENVDFGTVKGLEFGFDLRRTNGFAANINYTLSFANGTGSSSTTTSTIVWIDETPPNFISPLSFDQRHRLNASIDYRLGEGEGPTIFGAKLLENFGVNLLATAGSGFPFTGVVEPFNLIESRAPFPKGGVNQDRMPWQSRLDLRVDRRFPLGRGSSFTAFLWVQNVLDSQNTNNVWRFTGLPDEDGFLGTPRGAQFIDSATPLAPVAYSQRNRILGWVGIPRLTRLGVRFDF